MDNLKVVFVAAECAPIVKVGGLADVVGSLPKALAKLGVDVKIVIPKYGVIDAQKFPLKLASGNLEVFFNHKLENFQVYKTFLPASQIQVFLIEHPILSSNGVYLHPDATPKGLTEISRFAFFSEAATQFLDQKLANLDIVHCHDWHTAIIPDLIKVKFPPPYNLNKVATVLTIHNLGASYQGAADPQILHLLDLDFESLPQIEQDLTSGDINFLQQGIESADVLNTVSPQYASEIQQAKFGGELAKILKKRRHVLYGILNGIDYEIFNPETDSNLVKNYNKDSWAKGKSEDKKILKEIANLTPGPKMLIGLVSRIDEQKGLDLVISALNQILATGVQIVLLGMGDPEIEKEFIKLSKLNSGDLTLVNRFDTKLASQIYAGADCFLMPSRFEPCGLGQMIAQAYGTIPIVRDVGGLHDTVEDGVTGFKFGEFNSLALVEAVERAVENFKNTKAWSKMVEAAMSRDFSWSKSASEYVKLYRKAIEIKNYK